MEQAEHGLPEVLWLGCGWCNKETGARHALQGFAQESVWSSRVVACLSSCSEAGYWGMQLPIVSMAGSAWEVEGACRQQSRRSEWWHMAQQPAADNRSSA